MLYNDYEDYMRSVLGYCDTNCYNQFERFPYTNMNTYQAQYEMDNFNNCNTCNDNLEKMYPDIYKTLNPMVCEMCNNINQQITEEVLEKMIDEICKSEVLRESRQESRQGNSLFRDLIRILILNRLINQNRPPFRPGPGFVPGNPSFPPRPGKPPFRPM